MPYSTLTRRVAFAAAHRYRLPQWSDERNAEVFGACAHPNYHGHSYTCDVTVRGEVDATTGMLVDLGVLDRVLDTEVRQRFDHRNINLDVPEFADGALVPTGENLARFIFGRVSAALQRHVSEAGDAADAASLRLVSVTVSEDATLSSGCHADDG